MIHVISYDERMSTLSHFADIAAKRPQNTPYNPELVKEFSELFTYESFGSDIIPIDKSFVRREGILNEECNVYLFIWQEDVENFMESSDGKGNHTAVAQLYSAFVKVNLRGQTTYEPLLIKSLTVKKEALWSNVYYQENGLPLTTTSL